MNNYRISIVIPAYNAERYIRDCIKSIKRQTYKNFEIIVVDDCSIDKTFNIAQDEGIIVVRNKKNLGEGASRNIGARISKGEIIVHTDSDLTVPTTWLERILKDMKKFNVKCVAGGYAGSLGDSFIEEFSNYELSFRRRGMPKFVKTSVTNNFACDKNAFFEVGGFPEKYKCEDMVLSYKLSKKNLIYWDNDNGVYHHFRDSLLGYLKQQFYFSRDTVLTYLKYSELFFVRTHQGRQLYLEIILIYLFYIILFLKPIFSFFPLLIIVFINFNFLISLYRNKIGWLKSLIVILLRDFTCSFGVIVGIICSLLNIFK
ncbi:glycosyltransferase [Patescibacteria group bacterium]